MLIFLATVLVLGNVAYFLMVRDNEKRTVDLIDAVNSQMSKTVDVHLKDIERVSQAIFSDPIIQRNLRTPVDEIGEFWASDEVRYQLFQYSFPWTYIYGAYVFRMDGGLFYFTKGSSPPLNYSIRDEPWYPVVNSGSEPGWFYWPTGPETTAIRDKQLVFSLVRAINDVNTGDKLGYLKLDLHINMLNAIFDRNVRDITLRYLLIDASGNIIYDGDKQLTGRELPAEWSTRLEESEGRIKIGGEEYVFVTHASGYNNWRIVAFIPYQSIIEKSAQIRDALLLIGFASVLVVGIASYYLSTGILRPLSRMMATMKRVEVGDLKVRVDGPKTSDEIGKLSSLFNLMLDSINNLIDRIFQSELREKEAQLQALQSQINPHLLYNTLNAMKVLSRKRGVEDVAEMAESLGAIFRYSMQDWQKTVSLAEELEHIRNYMHIQGIRFGSRIRYVDLVDESLHDAEIIRLSIQPLVENAVIHGLERQLEAGTVEVSARLLHEDTPHPELEILVSDTGPGIPPEQAEAINALLREEDEQIREITGSKSGIALLNIQKRIHLLYGSRYGIRLDVSDEPGLRVSVTIPYKRRGDAGEHSGRGGRGAGA